MYEKTDIKKASTYVYERKWKLLYTICMQLLLTCLLYTSHRALLDDYIRRTQDDYRSLKVEADKRWRSHAPGYPNHEGPCARDIINRK